AEDGIRDFHVTGVQTCALPIFTGRVCGPSPQTRAPPGAPRRPSARVIRGPALLLPLGDLLLLDELLDRRLELRGRGAHGERQLLDRKSVEEGKRGHDGCRPRVG